MRTRHPKAPAAFIAFLITALLISAPSAIGTLAQSGSPPPTSGQVIAHGVDVLPGTTARWQIGIVTAPPGNVAQFGSFVTGFAVGWEQPVIATEGASGTSTYLEPGQAAFHPGGSTLRVTSTTGVDEGFIYIELTTAAPSLGAEFTGDPFTTPGGTHDVRLTSGLLAAAETGSFVPANDLPYLLYLVEGSVQATDAGGTTVSLAAGDAIQLDGTATVLAGATASAHWMIASIGPQVTVPPLPTPVSPTATPVITTPAASGSLVVQLLRCPDGTDPLIAPAECTYSDTVWDITIAPQGDDDPAQERTLVDDAVDIGDMSYRFTDLAPGTWVIRPDMSDMSPGQRIEITGDTIPLGGIWGVDIAGGAETEIYAYLIDPPTLAGTGDLIIEMYDCPPGVDPMVGATGCTLSVDAPNVEVSRITQSEMLIYNSQSDASTPEPGRFMFPEMPSGLFLLQLDETGTWLPDEVVIGGDAVWDHGFWAVTVPADGGSVFVAIYHTPAGPPEPPLGVGRVIIEQVDCPSGTNDPVNDPACTWSTAPWDVIAGNNATGESWSLYADAAQTGDGTWTLELPEGDYTVYVEVDPGWGVMINGGTETTVQLSVTADGESYLSIFSTAP